MNKFKIIYWLGSMKTEIVISAIDEDNAFEIFFIEKGCHKIIRIEEA